MGSALLYCSMGSVLFYCSMGSALFIVVLLYYCNGSVLGCTSVEAPAPSVGKKLAKKSYQTL